MSRIKSAAKFPPLFYFNGVMTEQGECQIEGEEADHILRSRRLVEGDSVGLTDGNGGLASASIIRIGSKKHGLTVSIDHFRKLEGPKVKKVLVSAIPKGDRQSVMFDMATQLGMTDFIPLHCDYSVARFQPRMRDRWQRIIRESCKQCRQVYFPEIHEEQSLSAMLKDVASKGVIMYADHGGQTVGDVGPDIVRRASHLYLVVGPEGGLSEKEGELLKESGAVALTLGDQILRTETAAVAVLCAASTLINGENL